MADLLYRRVYEDLRAAITEGRYAVGSRLPSIDELAVEYSVSPITLKRALDLLRADGLIMRRPRLGTFVTSATPRPEPSGGRPADTPLLGFVVTTFDDTFGSQVIEGVLAAAGDDAHVVVKQSFGDPDAEDRHVRALVDAGVAGIILLPSTSRFVPPALLELVTRRFPTVVLDRVFDGVPISAVYSDNLGGAKAATEHLLGLGHQHIAMISSSSDVSTALQRRLGYLQAHAEAHLPLDDRNELHTLGATVPGSAGDVESDLAVLDAFLAERAHVTGFLAAEYNLALLVREALRRRGREVPADASIVCFDHPVAFADRALFRYTHVRQDQARLGREAVTRLLAQIADPALVGNSTIPTTLVEGQSTAAP